MKTKILSAIALLFITANCFAQTTAATTQDEYNYMSKGYVLGMKSGADIKSGYSLGGKIEMNEGKYKVEYIPFMRTSGNLMVGYIVAFTGNNGPNATWYSLPMGNGALVDQFLGEINKLDAAAQKAFYTSYVELYTKRLMK